MKKLYSLILTILLVLLVSCSDDSSGGVTDPFGGGNLGGGNGNVTIAVSFQSNQQGGGVFSGTPSVAIKVSKITASVPALQYTESAQFDGTTVVNANVATEFIEYPAQSGIQSGQQWTFQFEGTIAADGKAFNITSNYTIP